MGGNKDFGKTDLSSVSGASKNRLTANEDNNVIKKQKIVENSTKKIIYQPIASLTMTHSCPPIRGTLTSVSQWGTTSFGTCFSNFVIKDSSGEIGGIIYRLKGTDFEKKFERGVTLTIEKAWVKPVTANYCQESKIKYEIRISQTLKTIQIESPVYAANVVNSNSQNIDVCVNDKSIETISSEKMFGLVDFTSDLLKYPLISIKEIHETIKANENITTMGLVIVDPEEKEFTVEKNWATIRWIRITDHYRTDINVEILDVNPDGPCIPLHSIILMHKATVQVYGNKKTLVCNNHDIVVDPHIPEALRLRNIIFTQKLIIPKESEERSVREYKKIIRNNGNYDETPYKTIRRINERYESGRKIDIIGIVTSREREKFEVMPDGSGEWTTKLIFNDLEHSEMELLVRGRFAGQYQIFVNFIFLAKNATVELNENKIILGVRWSDLNLPPDIPEMKKITEILTKRPVISDKCSAQYLIPCSSTSADDCTSSTTKNQPTEKRLENISVVEPQVARIVPSSIIGSDFKKINVIKERLTKGEIIDVLGIVTSQEDAKTVSCKNGLKYKMMIQLTDDSEERIWMAIWDPKPEARRIEKNVVVAAKKVQVHCWNSNKELNCTDTKSSLVIEPDINEARELKKWFNTKCFRDLPVTIVTTSFLDVIPCSSTSANDCTSSTTKNQPSEKKLENISIVEPQVARIVPSSNIGNDFTKINMIKERLTKGEIIDVLGIVTSQEDATIVSCKSGLKYKMMIELTDDSEERIWMTIWDPKPEALRIEKNVVVVAKKVQVHCWNNKKELNCTDKKSSLVIEPDINEARELKKWFNTKCLRDLPVTIVTTSFLDVIPCSSTSANDCTSSTTKNQPSEKKLENIFVVEPQVTRTVPSSNIGNDFKKINVIKERLTKGEIIDVLGIVTGQEDATIVPCKSDLQFKMMIELTDDSEERIWMTIWYPKSEVLRIEKNVVVAAKKVQVHCWNSNKELTCMDKMSSLIIEPDINEARELQKWFNEKCLRDLPVTIVPTSFPLSLIGNVKNGQTVNLLGILMKKYETKLIKATYSLNYARTIEIIDSSGRSIRLAMWGKMAWYFDVPEGSAIIATNIKIFVGTEVNGAFMPNSELKIDPPEFHENIEKLKSWFHHCKSARGSRTPGKS